MKFIATTACLIALTAAAAPALAQDAWRDIDTNPGSYWVAEPRGPSLSLHCDGKALAMVLFGGDTPLPAEVQTEGDILLVVRLHPSLASTPLTGSWLGPFDNALNGPFPSSGEFLRLFTTQERLEILGPEGSTLFSTPLTGASNVRFGFGEVCGI